MHKSTELSSMPSTPSNSVNINLNLTHSSLLGPNFAVTVQKTPIGNILNIPHAAQNSCLSPKTPFGHIRNVSHVFQSFIFITQNTIN